MRLPDFHPLVLALVDKLGLGRRQFYNVDIDPHTGSGPDVAVPPVTYTSFTGRTWTYGEDSPGLPRTRQARQLLDPRQPRPGAARRLRRRPRADQRGLPPHRRRGPRPRRDRWSTTRWRAYATTTPTSSTASASTSRSTEWVEGWARVIRDFDGYSMGGFLRDYAGLSDEADRGRRNPGEHVLAAAPLLLPQLPEPQRHQPRRPLLGDTGRQLAPAARPRTRACATRCKLGQRMIRLEYHDPSRDADPEGSRRRRTRRAGAWPYRPSPRTTRRPRRVCGRRTWRSSPSRSPPCASWRSSPRCRTRSAAPSSRPTTTRPPRCCWSSATGGGSSPRTTGATSWRASRPGLYEYYQQGRRAGHRGAAPIPTLHRPAAGAARRRGQGQQRHRGACGSSTARMPLRGPAVRPATHCFGGGSATDNPNRFMYYPSHPVEGSTAAAWCSPRTPGPTTPHAGTPCGTPSATSTPCATSRPCTAGASRCSSPAAAPPRAGPATRTPSARPPSTPRTR